MKTAFALLLALSAPAHASDLVSQCSWRYIHHGAVMDCQTYEQPSAQTQVIKVPAPTTYDEERAIAAVCRPHVTHVDELGVEHVEYDNPKCAGGAQ